MNELSIISASAGSGKTFCITEEILKRIKSGTIRPDQLIATTFTIKAANELKGRIREKLIEAGYTKEANMMNEALIGTINAVCLKLLKRYAFQAGTSPVLETLDENDQKVFIREILGTVTDENFIELSYKMYQSDRNGFDIKVAPYINHIEKIISKLRANDLSKDDMETYAKDSIDEFLGLYKGPIKKNEKHIGDILKLLEEGFENIDYDKINNPTAKGGLEDLQNIYKDIKSGNFIWQDFKNLAPFNLKASAFKSEFNKKFSGGFKQAVEDEVGCLFDNEQFRKDYASYISNCFAYAKEVLNSYKVYKDERGLLDFTDQETKLHDLIRFNESVWKDIAQNYALVVVDEFQDVSPLQLSIFLRLTKIIKDNIWVGDPKQSIYAFRGADPILMQSVVDNLKGLKTSQLTESYRSRASLINFSNAVFLPAFEKMKKEQIVLKQAPFKHTDRVKEKEQELGTAINFWDFNRSGRTNKKDNASSLAMSLHTLMEENLLVFDKEKAVYRKANFGDVAILCRSNKAVQGMANEFTNAGIPVSASGSGLVFEAEIIFISALLKLLILPSDALAKAEVLLYSTYNGDQEAMVKGRLKVEHTWQWGLEENYINSINSLRKKFHDFSPVHAIEIIRAELGIEELFASWGNLNQRLSNIDAFILHAQEYQKTCRRLDTASSIAGFLNFMQDLWDTGEDKKGKQTGNAVQIMTYHQSKGLEWPLVFLWDLDFKPRDRFFDVNATAAEKLNVNQPLNNRNLRLFIRPFSSGNFTAFDEIVSKSKMKNSSEVEVLEEEKRLFYVAVTRARDYLFLCSIKGNSNIPTLVNPELVHDLKKYTPGIHDSHLVWDSKAIRVSTESQDILGDFVFASYLSDAYRNYFQTSHVEKTHEYLKLNPSSAPKLEHADVKDLISIHERRFVDRKGINEADFGNVIHDLIAFYQSGMSKKLLMETIDSYLVEYEFTALIDVNWLADSIISLHVWLKEKYGEFKIYKELPIQHFNENGHYIQGYVDMLLELEDGLIIIDHKTFSMKEASQKASSAKALEYSGQLKIYEKVLEKSFKKKVLHKGLYFVFEGLWLEIVDSTILA